MKKVILLTSGELRHDFFRMYIALQPGITVIRSYCESIEKNLVSKIKNTDVSSLRYKHLQAREQTEKDFFEEFVAYNEDKTQPVHITKGAINDAVIVQDIINLSPDLIISYGCSIIKAPLIEAFPDRFINIHLGLSPYYRGSGTNYWPFVNNEPEYCGVTFMNIDTGIDTGKVIHQIRPDMYPLDTFHVICNRLLIKSFKTCASLINQYDRLISMPQIKDSNKDKIYKNAMFDESSVEMLYSRFRESGIANYLRDKKQRDLLVPIIENSAL
ncbi:formyl transferase [Nonlabens sp.]|uniref:formyl transferase n=1 Tax=Nonlabens sp. TaxID=1888209 RepID=UPI0032651033